MQTARTGQPALPGFNTLIYPMDPNEPIYCVPADRGKNFVAYLIYSYEVGAWLAPCADNGKRGMRLACFIDEKPFAGEGLRVRWVGTNCIKAVAESLP